MTRGSAVARAAVLALALVVSACATVAEKPGPLPDMTAPVVPPSVVSPPPPAPDPRAPLVGRHRERAEALERDGQLRGARDEWKIALTIDPGDAAAGQSLKALEGRIERAVAEKIEGGRAALARGGQAEARRQFLAALALDPSNRVAFQALQNEARDVEFVNHTVRQGDTLPSLALRYYGDRSRSEVIWETNQLPANPRLVAGTTLKIPEIPGVPFIHPEARRRAPRLRRSPFRHRQVPRGQPQQSGRPHGQEAGALLAGQGPSRRATVRGVVPIARSARASAA